MFLYFVGSAEVHTDVNKTLVTLKTMGGKRNTTVYLLWILTLLIICNNMAVSGSTMSSTSLLPTGAGSTDTPEITTTPVSYSTIADDSGPLPPGPTMVSVVPLLPLSLNVSWEMPSDHNSTSYNITLNETLFTANTNETSYVINGSHLLYGAFYYVDVRACENDRCSNKTTNHSATYPAQPFNMQTIDSGENHLRLQWFQQGGYESINVMVNSNGCSNVTDKISISSKSARSNGNSTITCNITSLPAAGGRYEVVIDIAFMNLKNNNQSDAYTRPATPGKISLVNQTTSEICVSWIQSGNVSDFTVTVNATISSNYSAVLEPSSSAENGNCSNCYNCSWPVDMCVRDLDTAGELYAISVQAFANDLYSTLETSLQATAPFHPRSISCSDHYSSSLTILIEPPESGKYEDFNITYSSQIVRFSENGSTTTAENVSIINNLTAGVMYLFDVKAQSFSVFGESVKLNCTTVPNAPEEFSSSPLSANDIELKWKTPAGYAHEYVFVYTNGLSVAENYTNGLSTSFVLKSLLSDHQYDTTIFTRNFGISSLNQTLPSYTFPDVVTNLNVENITDTKVDVLWHPPEYHDNIGSYELILSNSSGSCLKIFNLDCSNKQNKGQLYPTVTSNCIISLETTNCSKSLLTFHVKDLQASTNYSISVASLNPGGKGKPDSKMFITNGPYVPDDDWIVGAVCGAVFGFLFVLLVLILFYCWRNDKSPFKKKSEPVPSSVGGKENPNYEEEPEPIFINDFADHVSKMNQDSNYLFACEYLLLGKLSPKKSTIAAELPENRTKNRYTDVLPFDDPRVKLIPHDDIGEGSSSDYINASYLPGLNSVREYIAAQGPMRSTVDDFWLMIWQQKVATVVMVTNLFERGREKCEQYWPSDNEPICYGDISVGLKSESTLEYYTLRVMEVSFNSEKRLLTQYHFLTWPDFGVPEEVEHILDFVTEVRERFRGTAPMLVHCSAGVGRTGTFIVVDHLLQLIRREQFVDLFHIVLNLRQHRPKMIQAESQYIFAHECIKMAISRGYHMKNSLYMADPVGENGNCLYVNASDIFIEEPPLYANAGEIREHPV